jgi:hypothetical protein
MSARVEILWMEKALKPLEMLEMLELLVLETAIYSPRLIL